MQHPSPTTAPKTTHAVSGVRRLARLARRLSLRLSRSLRYAEYQPAPKRVLLATDDDDLRAELIKALEKDHHHVIELDDGSELLDYLDAPHASQAQLPAPHAIIASLGMAGMSGLAVLEALRVRGNRTPFIGLAGLADADCIARAVALGAAFIFEAPLRVDDVRAALFSLPGGSFTEATLSHEARVQACRRGTHFMHPDTER